MAQGGAVGHERRPTGGCEGRRAIFNWSSLPGAGRLRDSSPKYPIPHRRFVIVNDVVSIRITQPGALCPLHGIERILVPQ